MAVVRRTGGDSQRLEQIITGISDFRSKVGFFESAKYEDGTPVAYVAAIQEFGSPQNQIPPRSFMRKTISEKTTEWKSLLKSGAKAILAGNETSESVIEKIGLLAAGDIRKTISEITEPALKESTIKARMRKRANKKTVGNLTKPLVDSGLMLASVQNVTEKT